MIDYIRRKYGEDCVCQIITFSTMAARAAIRNVGRALNIPLGQVDVIAKMIPQELGITISSALDVNPEFQQAYESDQAIKELVDVSMQLEGLPIHCSVHAAGVLITDKRGVVNYGPLVPNEKGGLSIAYDKHFIESMQLLKSDCLGLSTLGVIGICIKYIKKNHGVDIDVDNLYKGEDPNPYKLFCAGYTDAIFQCEGASMTNMFVRVQPKNLEDVTAVISIMRPGPMSEANNYVNNRAHPEQIKFALKGLDEILSSTSGVLIYQEQCMRAVV